MTSPDTDRTLLELAARAAGWGKTRVDERGWFYVCVYPGEPEEWELWNALEDDGDALRLAVKLGIQSHYTGNAYVRWDRGEKTDAIYGPDDPCAAVRRAIVRAAAAIGAAK